MNFGTAVSCIDGRIHLPLIKYMQEKFHIEFVDFITEPGMNKVLAENEQTVKIGMIKEKIDVSINAHQSNVICVTGHDLCAGNPVKEKQHLQQIKQSVSNLKKCYPDVKVFGVWLDSEFNVNPIV